MLLSYIKVRSSTENIRKSKRTASLRTLRGYVIPTLFRNNYVSLVSSSVNLSSYELVGNSGDGVFSLPEALRRGFNIGVNNAECMQTRLILKQLIN